MYKKYYELEHYLAKEFNEEESIRINYDIESALMI